MQSMLTVLATLTVVACTSSVPAPPPTTGGAGTGAPDGVSPGTTSRDGAGDESAGLVDDAAAGPEVATRPATRPAPSPPPPAAPAPPDAETDAETDVETDVDADAETDVETDVDADADVVAFLDALEADGRTLTALTSRVLYEVEDALLGERVLRRGDLIYRVEPDTGDRRFGILFNERIVDRRRRESRRSYIFTDRWLVEVDYDARLFVKRELVPPGKQFDPFRLGEGPIPLPIGQRRADVLDRFVVTSIAPPAEGPLRRLAPDVVRGLRLVPRPTARDVDDVKHMDLFFDRTTLLPVGVEVIETNGDRKTARLDDARRNPTLGPDADERLGVDVPEGDWRVDVRRLEGS